MDWYIINTRVSNIGLLLTSPTKGNKNEKYQRNGM